VAKLDEVIPVNGVIIHSQSDWPCSGCRPSANEEQEGTFLCIRCAISLTAASIRRIAARSGNGPTESSMQESESEECSGAFGWVPPALWGHG
jgi:hypothetical protein